MKKIVLSILCILPFLGAWSQASEPWFYDGKQWAHFSFVSFFVDECTTTSVIQGSAEINGITYWKVFKSDKEDLSDLTFSGQYFREANDKIYLYNPAKKEEELYMDFSMKQGDVFNLKHIQGMDLWVVAAGDTILPNADGISRKYMEIGFTGSDHVWDIWIEGIGSLCFGIDFLCIGCTGGGNALLCCHDSEKSLYMDEYYHTCFREMLPIEKLVEQNKRWAVEITSCDMSNTRTDTYLLKGNTLINNRFYKKVWSTSKEDLTDLQLAPYCIYESDGKVYHYNYRDKQTYLWFDFCLKVGDVFTFKEEPPIDSEGTLLTGTVTAITDTIFANGDGKTRKCWQLNIESGSTLTVIEGVGTLESGINPFDINMTGNGRNLLCCHDGSGELIYQSEKGACYINTGIETNESNDIFVKVQCLDKGKLSFSWDITLALQQLSIYTENGTLYKKETIPSNECQLTVHNLPQGTFIYVFTSVNNNEKYKGKIYVK